MEYLPIIRLVAFVFSYEAKQTSLLHSAAFKILPEYYNIIILYYAQ